MGLDPFPAASVATARERAEEGRRFLAAGLDPLDELRRRRTEDRLAATGATTFADAATAYLEAKVEADEGRLQETEAQAAVEVHIGELRRADDRSGRRGRR